MAMALRCRPLSLDCISSRNQSNDAATLSSEMSFCSSFLRNPFGNRHRQLATGMKVASPPLITALIKRKKNYPLDSVVQRQKKLKLVTNIKDLLIKQPGMVMSLKRLGMFRKKLRLDGSRRVITLLRKYPGVFEVFEEGVNSLYFRLTPEAEDQVFEEIRLKGDLEASAVIKLRKMLMMSLTKTLLLSKIDHVKRHLGLPDDYRDIVIDNYPDYFKVIMTPDGSALELTSWDPELAVSAWEKRRMAAPEEDDTISGRPRRFAKLDLPPGHVLKRKDADWLRRFQQVPYVSPYLEFSHYRAGTIEAEKHACGVVHELLSLMIERRTLVDHLTHYRKDFRFSQQLHGMIVRHPELFYVSLKGDRDCVFLKEAYRGAELIEKDPLMLIKERLGELVALSANRLYRAKTENKDDEVQDDDNGSEDDDDYDDESDDGEIDGWRDDDEAASDDELDDTREHSSRMRQRVQRRAGAVNDHVRAAEKFQNERIILDGENSPSKRIPRRPLGYVLREKSLATQADIPREKW